jgi:hypothetical protein
LFSLRQAIRTCITDGVRLWTPAQAEAKRLQAISFLHRLGREEDAERFEDMSTEEYAEHRGATIRENNPGRPDMSDSTKQELQETLDEVIDLLEQVYTPEASREELAEAVGKALDILQGEEEEEEGDEIEDEEGEE